MAYCMLQRATNLPKHHMYAWPKAIRPYWDHWSTKMPLHVLYMAYYGPIRSLKSHVHVADMCGHVWFNLLVLCTNSQHK